MRQFKIATLIAAGLAALLLAGCGGMVITGAPEVNKAAFGQKKRFAVVSIASARTFQGERGMFQEFKDADEIPGANSQPLINKLNAKIMGSLSASRQLTLVPESRVLGHKAYKAMVEDPRTMKVLMFNIDMNTANSYKYFTEPQKYAKLAQELGVDGVIGITMNFSVAASKGFLTVRGVSLGKKSYSATATITAVAYNPKGEVIWQDSTIKEADSEDSRAFVMIDTSAFTGADFQKLHPSAIEIGGKAVDVLLARFEDTLAGKEVERVQSMK